MDLEEVILDPPSQQDRILGDLSNCVPEQAKSSLLKSRVVTMLFWLIPSFQHPQLYHPMVTEVNAANPNPQLGSSSQPLLSCF